MLAVYYYRHFVLFDIYFDVSRTSLQIIKKKN